MPQFSILDTFRHEFSFRLKIVLCRCCLTKMVRLARNNEQGCGGGEQPWRSCPATPHWKVPPSRGHTHEDTKLTQCLSGDHGPDNYTTLPWLRIKHKDDQPYEGMALDPLRGFHLSTGKQKQASVCLQAQWLPIFKM